MARKLFVLAVLLVAGSIGVLGYQVLDYWLEGGWPPVPLQSVWDSAFAALPGARFLPGGDIWRWLGGVPVSAAGIVAAYVAFLASDSLRRR